ncbi:MAG TPA: SNF2-related protein, partial [Streptomyces sp.]|nr:SNF2-related protein [Streptomyces sp.]
MGDRFATPEDVRRHWRLEEGDRFRITETKDEAANRRSTVRRREERASELELVGEALVIARMHYSSSGRYRWGVFHAGTAFPVLILEYEDVKPSDDGARARALAEALDQWRDSATGEPFDWSSDGLLDRLRSPYGRGLLDQVRGWDPEARWAGSPSADAEIWETDDGLEYTYDQDGSTVTVYDPDGLLIARGKDQFDVKTRKSAFIGEMRDGRRIAGRWSSHFVENAVWQHRIAQLEPAARDTLWIYYLDDRPIVHGTDRYAADYDDLKALLRSSGFTWSGHAKAFVTAGTTRPIARAQSVDRLARALYAQGRMVEIRADENRLRGILAPAAPAPAAARSTALAPAATPSAADPAQAPAAPAPEAGPVLTPQDLTDEQLAAELERLREERNGTAFGSPRYTRLDEQIAPLQREQDQREIAQVENRPDPAGMEDEEIAAEREALAAVLGRNAFHHHSRAPLVAARQERDELLRVEQARRTAAEVEARTPVTQMTDEDLQAEGAQLVKDRHRRPPEAAGAFDDRVAAVGGEIADRRLQAWGEQPPAETLDNVELTEALEALRGQQLSHTEFAGSYPAMERVKKAFEARREELVAEIRQRDEKAFEALLETDGRIRLEEAWSGASTMRVRIDGRWYGELMDSYPGARARLWHNQDITRGEVWRTDALRWLIQEYEKDPETRDTRTWGTYVGVELPPSFVDQLTTHFSDLTLSEETEKYLIGRLADSSRSQSWDENGKKIMVHALDLPERTLPVLERMGRRLVDRLDDELDSDDRKIRDKAKRARPNVLRALDDLTALLETRGLEPLAADNADAEAPQDGETDSERVRDDGPPALGDVPAAGAGRDGGPGGVLPGSGAGRAAADRGADRGEDGRSDAGDGSPAAGGQAESGPADGPGAGAEGDRVPGAGGGQPGRGAAPVVFRPASQDDLAPAGERAKAAANLEAVRVLKRVQEEKRAATAAEQQVMARWSGWGSVPEIFATRPREDDPAFGPGGEREGGYAAAAARWESFADVRDPLRTLLGDDEWRAAAASTLSAHYTPPEITSALWQALADLGFDGGEVLEPGSGAGVSFGTAPESARLTGVEIDPTSAAISRLLAPGVTVLNESFADTVAPDGTFDAAIGNVPFARVALYDARHNRGRHRIHNHFLIKSVALTRPGGVVALITSRHTLDAENSAARSDLFEMADLLGAVRLPNKAFARSAGTDVVTDVLLLRRRMDGEEPLDRSWLTSQKRQVGEHRLPVNDYFAAHPEHVLGTLTSRMGAHGPEVAVDGDPDVGAPLRTALRQITDGAVLARRWYAPHPDGPYRPPLRLRPAAEVQDFTGRLSADVDGKLWQASGDGEQVPVELPPEQHAQLAALIELKDLVRGLNELDRSGSDAALADAHRRLTKEAYERYVTAYGPLSRPRQQQHVTTQTGDGGSVQGLTAWGYFLNDPQAYEVLALEMWEADTETVHVSEILDHAPAVRRSILGQRTDDPQQALDAVVAERGFVDLPHIAWMLRVDEDEARRRLARSVFTDPLTGDLLYSADYLSGDVRTKLEIARQAARRDPAFQVNVAELERVQPREMLPGQFAIRLGASWLPEDLVQQFFREYLGDAHLVIQHSGNGNWHILKGRGLSEENEVKHSAGGLAPLALLNRVLNGGSMTGRPSDDEEAARAVRVKAEEWRDAFEAWVLDDSVRAARAAEVYNRVMNNRAVRDFTGSRPSLAGLDPEFTPYDHQLAAAARMAHERCLVLAHEVGAGKTATMAIGMMAMRNTGQVDKPLVVVPNYLVEQWEKEIRRLFPAARILTLTSADLADGKRDRVLQYVRANSFDMVIMSHSLFDSIPLSPEFYEFYHDEELRKLDAQILHERRRDGKSISLKQLQERRQQHEQDLKAKAAAVRTPGQVYLDDLGFDFFAVDEAHEYKNLAVRSKIPGARVAGSAKAQHLHAVLEWARLNKPKGPIGCLATGTPLSNAIGELHTLLLLAAPELLRALGIEEFDAFATMYGRMVERLEMTVDGKGFKSVERFASFHSVNSLLRQL